MTRMLSRRGEGLVVRDHCSLDLIIVDLKVDVSEGYEGLVVSDSYGVSGESGTI